MARRHTRYLALLCSVSLISPAIAAAGPDDGKHVATQSHVDSPKTYWENNSFQLFSEWAGKKQPTSETVAWIGKGWGSAGNQYQFTLPDDGTFDFVGQGGGTYYTAPNNILGTHDPIWLGFGADANLPADTFRDATTSLDLLSVEGPGEVELFGYYETGTPGSGLNRLLGSTESAPHSAFLNAGAHTHNYTLFTKPGRYELTYQTTARTKDGKVVTSAPTKAAIQVGGASPVAAPTPSLRERYDAAPAADKAALDKAGYKLAIAPKAGIDRSGDEYLSTISFNAENKASGTLTLLIDGYHLTDLAVNDGHAEWTEMLGPEASKIQAVFTPAAGSTAPKWISAPLDYAGTGTGEAADVPATSTTESAADFTDRTGQARALFDNSPRHVSASGITATIEPYGEDASKLIVETEDKNFSGFIKGGFRAPGSAFDSLPFTGVIANGRGEYIIDDGGSYDGEAAVVDIVPHPWVDAGSTTVRLTDDYTYGKKFTKQGSLPLSDATAAAPSAPAAPSAAPSSATPTIVETSVAKSEPAAAPQVCSEKISLERGHVDIKAKRSAAGFDIVVKDETGQVTQEVVDRPLNEVVLAVHDNALVTRPEKLADPKLDFMGPVGEKFFLLPQTQNQAIIWPGYNTQDIDYSEFNGTVDLHIEPRRVPEGATWGLFLTKGFGNEFDPIIDSTKNDFTIETTFAAHTHSNWAFTKPGVYELNMSYTATTKDGKKVAAQPQTLTIAVGDAGIAECQSATPAPNPEPSPEPTPVPSPKPTPETTAAPKPTPTTSAAPTTKATAAPTAKPTVAPTTKATVAPTTTPTTTLTSEPAAEPTSEPTTSAPSSSPAPTSRPAPTSSAAPTSTPAPAPAPGGSSDNKNAGWFAIIPVVVLGLLGVVGTFIQEHGKELFERFTSFLNLKF